MADFSHLQAVMGTMRPQAKLPGAHSSAHPAIAGFTGTPKTHSSSSSMGSASTMVQDVPSLENEPSYVGKVSPATIEKAMATVPAGYYVVRKSERAANVFVLMVKLSAATGMQKRILFTRGKFVMDVDGTKRAHSHLAGLLTLEPMAKFPARTQVESVQRGEPPKQSMLTVPRISTKMVLEEAMTNAEKGQWKRAMSMVRRAQEAGASAKNLNAATQYIESFIPEQALKQNLAHHTHTSYHVKSAPIGNESDSGNSSASGLSEPSLSVGTTATQVTSAKKQFASVVSTPISNTQSVCKVLVRVRLDSYAQDLGLGGPALCEISHDRVLSILPQNSADVDPRHKWPLPLLRRYGQQGTSFYFEAGRRCPSGPTLLYLDMSLVDVERLFAAADRALEDYRREVADQKNQELQALREFKRKAEAEKLEAEKAQQEAILKYKKEAEEIARQQIAARNKAAEEAKQRAEEEAKEQQRAELAKEFDAQERIAKMQQQKQEAEERQQRAAQLELSETSEKMLTLKANGMNSAAIGIVEETEEWGKGKSRIWKALNPKPLAYQTGKDRRDAENKIDVGGIGQRGYMSMLQVTQDDHEIVNEELALSPTKVTTELGVETINTDLDQDEVADDIGVEDKTGSPVAAEEADQASEDGEEEEEEEEEEDLSPDKLADFDEEFELKLKRNREQRALDEARRKHELHEEHLRNERKKREALEKELAVIAAKNALEEEERQRKADAVFEEAQKNVSELQFTFTFSGS